MPDDVDDAETLETEAELELEMEAAEVEAAEVAVEEELHDEIVLLFEKHNPAKLAQVDALIEKYGAEEFLEKMRAKYLRESPQRTARSRSRSPRRSRSRSPRRSRRAAAAAA